MKYRAPEGVTEIFFAGQTIAPDATGGFDAAEEWASELEAHGCAAIPETTGDDGAASRQARVRTRSDKVN